MGWPDLVCDPPSFIFTGVTRHTAFPRGEIIRDIDSICIYLMKERRLIPFTSTELHVTLVTYAMKLTTFLSLAILTSSTISATLQPRQNTICQTVLLPTAQCCSTDILSLNLDCANRESNLPPKVRPLSLTLNPAPSIPSGVQNFIDTCPSIKQQAQCYAIPMVRTAQSYSRTSQTKPNNLGSRDKIQSIQHLH